jgi:hypothetical protein
MTTRPSFPVTPRTSGAVVLWCCYIQYKKGLMIAYPPHHTTRPSRGYQESWCCGRVLGTKPQILLHGGGFDSGIEVTV